MIFLIRRILWELQRRAWGLSRQSVYQPEREPSGRLRGPWFLTLATVALLFAGCHGAERTARTALDVSAHALVEADVAIAPLYSSAADRALADAADRADYDRRMERWNATETALRTAREAMLAAESAVDASGADGALPALGCAAVGIAHLRQALADAGVNVPRNVGRAIDLLDALGAGACP